MAIFDLDWEVDDIEDDDNIISIRASYRYKTVGGAWITTGFTPANDMDKNVVAASSPDLDENKVVEFRMQAICTLNGPTDADNGIQEAIRFECIDPTITQTETTVQAVLDVTGLDISKAKFVLKKSSDNSIVQASTTVTKVSNSITFNKTGLTGSTNYYLQIELLATVNNVEVSSADSDYLGAQCSPYPFTTDAPAICDPITAGTIESIEI